jgi:transposase-like protein
MDRSVEEEFAYLILDARYEKVREAGVIRSRAVLVALGVDWEGRRQVLAVELANRESATSWKEFLLKLKSRGLRGVVLAVSDDHAGLKRSLAEVLPQAYWQRWPDVQLIARAHFHGMRNIGATLTSFEDTFKGTPLEGYYNTDKEQKRQAVNQWIRSSNTSQSHSVGLYVIRRLSLQW